MTPEDRTEPLHVALSADVDPDANRPLSGRPDAVSAGTDPPEARYEACFEGLRQLLDLLEERSLPATFFWEGRALGQLAVRRPELTRRILTNPRLEHGCHGQLHEDFCGADTEVALGALETRAALQEAGRAFVSVFGRPPQGFRAPYCRLTPQLRQALAELGYRYDSSLTRQLTPDWHLRPYALDGAAGVTELALCRTRDRHGRTISSYLWQLFEGRRPVADYVHMVGSMRETCPGGLLQIALHPWHLVVSEDGRPLAEPGAPLLARLLDEVAGMAGIAFTSPARYVER